MTDPERRRPLCIVGPTASGKSHVAMEVARQRSDIELVSVDSMQVYRRMDIGTAKPTAAERNEVRHHLIDVAEPSEEFTVSRFQQDWYAARRDIISRGATPVLVGGTGLYFRAVVDDLEIPGRFPDIVEDLRRSGVSVDRLHGRLAQLDPLAASRIDPGNERRILRALEVTLGSGRPFSSFGPGLTEYPDVPFELVGLRMSKAVLDDRVNRRYGIQMEQGFLEEVRSLAIEADGLSHTARQALGYRELLRHVEDGEDLDEVLEEARTRTRRFARRQMKWFGRDPRITWIDLDVDGAGVIDYGPAIDAALTVVDRR